VDFLDTYSFITTYRNRPECLKGFISNVRRYYPLSEIIIVEQKNDAIYIQGQLYNLGYSFSNGQFIILMDADIRFRNRLQFSTLMAKYKHPFIAYDRLINCKEDGTLLDVRFGSNKANGGCCIFTRSQFEESSGYSNLLFGWGGDDDVINKRVNGFRRMQNTLLHVKHDIAKRDPEIYDENVRLLETEEQRKKDLDGFRQTIGHVESLSWNKNVLHVQFDKIGVVPSFAYASLLRSHLWK